MTGAVSIRGRLEGLLLLGLGGATLAFAFHPLYRVLLHPSFRWVTAGGAVLLLLMGIAAVARPRTHGGFGPLLAFGAWILLVVIGRPLRGNDNPFSDAPLPPAVLERPGYESLGAAELYRRLAREEGAADPGMGFVLGGLAKRSPELEAEDAFLLVEPVMACCLADAVGLGLRVDLMGTPPPPDGERIYVYGTLRAAAGVAAPSFRMGAIVFTSIAKEHVLEAHEYVTYRSLLADVVEKIPHAQGGAFLRALEETGLAEELRGEGPFTVFVPLDAPFRALADEAPDLRHYLEGFVVRGRLSETDLLGTTALEALSGRQLEFRVVNGSLVIEGARVLFGDIVGRNGVVHLVHPPWPPGD